MYDFVQAGPVGLQDSTARGTEGAQVRAIAKLTNRAEEIMTQINEPAPVLKLQSNIQS